MTPPLVMYRSFYLKLAPWYLCIYINSAEMHAKFEMLVKETMEQYNNKIKEKEQEKKIKKKNK